MNKFLYRAVCLLCCFSGFNVSAGNIESAIDEQSALQNQAIESQHRINKLSQQTTDMVYEYQQVLEQLNTLQVYNRQLEKLLDSQNRQIRQRTGQINNIDQTEQAVVPLMLRMIATLEQFIELDMPFQLQERKKRVEQLKQLMDRADISTAEKYRSILQAFLSEMEYGRTIESWQGKHPLDEEVMVNFFRIGRLVLIFQSLDKNSAFYWSREQAKFKSLPPEYLASLQRGFKVAGKQLAPEFIKVPIDAPNHDTHDPGGSNAN